ncbi:sulfite oxidase [Poronia punctata]|nr:sulfite oxidase [Poronia punctata]
MQRDIPEREIVHNAQPVGEWAVEQGFTGVAFHLLDQTKAPEEQDIFTRDEEKKSDEHRVPISDEDLAKDELPGWDGYVEWEDYPEKKEKAHDILASHEFPPPPEFQLQPIPDTNPVLEGNRLTDSYPKVGGRLKTVPEESWSIVQKEKHPDMLHILQFPYNGEPPKRLVTSKPVTPNELHFVRNHGGIPKIDPSKWSLRIEGNDPNHNSSSPITHTLTLSDLQNETLFPRMERLVTIQCSGTRRIEQISLYAGEGDEMINAPWAEGAISTARYTGVSLKKILKRYFPSSYLQNKHIELFGADTYIKQSRTMNYAISIPYSKVRSDEVILAWEMNGEPLPLIHGAPVRAVVMGYIGARSVKWLYRVRVMGDGPSRRPVQSREYLYFNQQVGKHNQRWTDGIQIQEMPVSSAIMTPWNKQVVIHAGKISMRGWAYSGGGRWPERVEVSADGGFSWYAVPVEDMSPKHKFAWRTWHVDLPCDVEGWVELLVRCWDNNTQPIEVRSTWNWGLHVTSSAHRVRVYSVNKSKERTRARLEEFEKRGISFAPLTRPTEFPTMSWEEYEDFFARNGPRDVEE